MAKNEKRLGWVSEILLQPVIEWAGPAPPTEVIADLHHQAHLQCFIANSVRSQVRLQPHSIGHEPPS
jgi:organic hydroperoxide reductase OsmC/OhrA